MTQWFMQQAGNSGPAGSGHASDICFFYKWASHVHTHVLFSFSSINEDNNAKLFPRIVRKKKLTKSYTAIKAITKVAFMREVKIIQKLNFLYWHKALLLPELEGKGILWIWNR